MTPVGPMLVTPDEVDHARDLRLECIVDGESMQDGRTSDLIFDPPFLVSYISTFVTLEPGDLILTGTPSGVGFKRNPPRFLKPGTEVVTRIEGIGELRNRCIAAPHATGASAP
jgi:acylpyruvate hydrolase